MGSGLRKEKDHGELKRKVLNPSGDMLTVGTRWRKCLSFNLIPCPPFRLLLSMNILLFPSNATHLDYSKARVISILTHLRTHNLFPQNISTYFPRRFLSLPTSIPHMRLHSNSTFILNGLSHTHSCQFTSKMHTPRHWACSDLSRSS